MKWDSDYVWSPKYAKWIVLSLLVFFTILILWEMIGLWSFKRDMRAVHPQSSIVVKDKAPTFKLYGDLFGVYVPKDLDVQQVKQSSLRLELVGILLAEHMENSQVIIKSANGEEKMYQLGDTIPGNAVVKRIMANGILLERDGVLERLSLPKNGLTFEPVPPPLIKE